ncbi:PilZ domain-containing protein [Rheinheimera marina]|uniref:PilZ domain-containing protein n=1 Tax=Rheinheimera marina TaxID=1774958 RepID=A0ABV9JLZ0_9GAMM
MTTSDLAEHIGVIERLKPLLNTPDFDQVFKLLTEDLPKSKQFLIKMELKRLGQPCSYYIDLRGRVDGEVRPYEHNGQTHYMDDVAIRTFEKGVKQYSRYTVGVFEDVSNTSNNHRVRYQQEQAQRKLMPSVSPLVAAQEEEDAQAEQHKTIQLIKFAEYQTRSEERMNFSIDIELILDNQDRLQATTSDLSVSGCKIKLAKEMTFAPGQKVAIFFRGLEQEFALGLTEGIPYQVVEQEPAEKGIYLRLKRLPLVHERGFTDFLQNFIHGNKRRYKVNLDNTYEAVYVKGYEQFFLPRMTTLPVFLAVNEGKATPLCALTTENNRSVLHYFQDEQRQNVLSQLLSARRLKQCLSSANQSCILYTFTHAAKGRLFFYSATADELAQSAALRQVFIGFGAQKPSWRVFNLHVTRTNPAHAHSLLSLPNSASQEIQKLNQPPGPLILNFIKDLRYVASLTELNTTESTALYQRTQLDQSLLNQLKIFGHAKLDSLPAIEAAAVHYVNLRSESRFLYRTEVLVGDGEMADVRGFTRDFSSKGLQVECTEPVDFERGDQVQITLPQMQKITTKHKLLELPYEVMAVSKNKLIMNLRIIDKNNDHQGKQFFQQLIANNRSKLTLAEEAPKFPGLGPALRNMYLKALNCFVFYIHRQGIRYHMDVVAQGASPSSLHRLLQRFSLVDGELNLQPLLKNNATNLQFANQLKKMKRQELPFRYEVYLRYIPEHDKTEQSLQVEFDFDLPTANQRKNFVDESLQQGLLFAYRIFLSRTGRPDTEHIAKELGYVSTYAIHKAKVLEEELWSVVGIGEVQDISDEVLTRYNVAPSLAEQQRQKRQQLLHTKPVRE